jgi:hypothetical protein
VRPGTPNGRQEAPRKGRRPLPSRTHALASWQAPRTSPLSPQGTSTPPVASRAVSHLLSAITVPHRRTEKKWRRTSGSQCGGSRLVLPHAYASITMTRIPMLQCVYRVTLTSRGHVRAHGPEGVHGGHRRYDGLCDGEHSVILTSHRGPLYNPQESITSSCHTRSHPWEQLRLSRSRRSVQENCGIPCAKLSIPALTSGSIGWKSSSQGLHRL